MEDSVTNNESLTSHEALSGSSVSELKHVCHPACMVCSDRQSGGLGLQFEPTEDGWVQGRFGCDASYQGYPDRLHGGVVAMLLDAAMTHCLFARNITAVTAKLEVRYRHPVLVSVDAIVRAKVVRESSSAFELQGELIQDGRVRAEGHALFCEPRPAK